MEGLGKLFYALSTGDITGRDAYRDESLKLSQASLYRSKMEEALAKASIEREKAAAISRLRDRNNYQDRNSQGSIAFNPVRYRDDATLAFANSANDFATAGNTYQTGDFRAEAGNALRGGDMSLGNRMLMAAEGKPVELTKIQGDMAFNPYEEDAALRTTPLGQSQIDLRGTQELENRARAGSLGAQTALYAAQADNARRNGGRTPSSAIQNWEFAQTLPPEQQAAFLATSGGRGNAMSKPMPASLQKEEDSDLADIQLATAISTDLEKFAGQVEKGDLKLGLTDNYVSRGRNYFNDSTENSRNYASFRAGLEKLRNDSLRLNKGVQTEGDAQRAWNEILENINDGPLVAKRLREVQAINLRAADLKDQLIQNRRNSYGKDPLDTSTFRVGSPDRDAPGDLTDDDMAELERLREEQR